MKEDGKKKINALILSLLFCLQEIQGKTIFRKQIQSDGKKKKKMFHDLKNENHLV